MEVSLVIPAYNASRTLEATLRSVSRQLEVPTEVIVVNDASQDDTEELALSALRELSIPGQVISKKANAGVAAARNTGVMQARCAHIAFCDSDDILTPAHLKALKSTIANDPLAVLAFGDERIVDTSGRVRILSVQTRPRSKAVRRECIGSDALGEEVFRLDPESLFFNLLGGNFVPLSGCIIAREAFERIGGFNETLRSSEDRHLFLRLARMGTALMTRSHVCDKLEHEQNITWASRQTGSLDAQGLRQAISLGLNVLKCMRLVELDSSLNLASAERGEIKLIKEKTSGEVRFAASSIGLSTLLEIEGQLRALNVRVPFLDRRHLKAILAGLRL